MNYRALLSNKNHNIISYAILIIANFVVALDYTRGGVIYTTDSTIFVYNYPEVSLHYLAMAIYSYYPWLPQAPRFSIFTFIYNILPFLFSLIPFISDTLYLFTLSLIGTIFLYKLIYSVLIENYRTLNKKYIEASSLVGVLFYLMNPQILVNGTFADIGIGTYVYVLMPVFLYGIRKIFTSNQTKEFLSWYFVSISISIMLYYFIVPFFVLMIIIIMSAVLSYYSLIALRRKKYIRPLLVIVPLIVFILVNFDSIYNTYKAFTSPSFIEVSYLYWVSNAQNLPLYETLRGLIGTIIHLPQLSYVLSFAVVLVYVTPLILSGREKRTSSEILFFIILFLVTTFLYSMPNVPFSDFFKTLFFKFPILADLRTQWVLVGPFESLLLSIVVSFGTYNIIDVLSVKGKRFVVLGLVLIIVSTIIGVNYQTLIFGSNSSSDIPMAINIPEEFIAAANYINAHSSLNSSVFILPLSATENGEKWYSGNNLFNLFLKSRVILGGGYYSHSNEERSIIDNAEIVIAKSSYQNKTATLYLYNFLYLYNIHYIIFEKDYYAYNGYYLEFPFPLTKLNSGLNNFSKVGLIDLVYNNSFYSIYATKINSSFVFVSYENISGNLTRAMLSENLTRILSVAYLSQINPAKYVIYVSPSYINDTIYMYIMLPYSSYIEVRGADVINKSVFLGGYMLLKLHVNSSKLTLIYQEYYKSFLDGVRKLILEILLPIILAIITKLVGDKLKVSLPKITSRNLIKPLREILLYYLKILH